MNLTLKSLNYNITQNLIKINNNLVLQKNYKTAPRLLLTLE